MLEVKNKKGITLVALIVTIIVLLILAGVSIAVLRNNGLIGNIETAKKEYHNSQIEENAILADFENKMNSVNIGGVINGNRNENSLNMRSPVHLVTATLANSTSSTRAAGTYIASSSKYTKSNGSKMADYLTFQENTGWKVLKEGWYYVSTYSSHEYHNANGAVMSYLRVNNANMGGAWTYGYISSADRYTAWESAQNSIYLSEGDIIDFYFAPNVIGCYSTAYFLIYAMFE